MQYPLTVMAQEGLSFAVARLHPDRGEIAELQAAGISPARIAALYPLDAAFYAHAAAHLLDHLNVKQAVTLSNEFISADLEEKFRALFHAPLSQAYNASALFYFGSDFTETLRARVHNLLVITHAIATYDHAARLEHLAAQDASIAHRATVSRWRALHAETMRYWDALQALEAATTHLP